MHLHASKIVALLIVAGLCLAIPSAPSFAQAATPASAPATSDQDSQLCTVAGTVTSAATGEALRKVDIVLSLESAETKRRPLTTTTDAAGHFSLDRVPPGRYFLEVTRDGYLGQQYGQENEEGSGAVMSLAAGQKMTDLIFRLQKAAVITGRVVDEDGDPIIRAQVEVLRRRTVNRAATLETMGNENTDDQGNYRIFGLSPGRYFVRATPNGRLFVVTQGDDDQTPVPQPKSVYTQTYYPGTTDSTRASAIDVKAGDEIPRIDFFLTPSAAQKTYRIRGHVTVAIPGQSEGMVNVAAIPHDRDDTSPFGRSFSRPDEKTGSFSLERLVPGSYTVAAMSFGSGRARVAAQEVEVVDSDVDSVSLVLTRGADISGRVTFEGDMAAKSQDVVVELEPRNPSMPFLGTAQAAVQPDGSFSVAGTGDGAYSLRLASKCRECYLKSATAGGTDLLAQHITVANGAGPTNIELIYSSNTGKVNGTVTGSDDLPLAAANVVLVKDGETADEQSRRPSASTDQNGRFEIIGVPPGHYKALAWGKLDLDNADDADFMKPFLAKADSVDVAAEGTATLQLKVIPASASEPAN